MKMGIVQIIFIVNGGYDFTSTTQVRLTNYHHGCGHSHAEYEDLKTRYSTLERERNDLQQLTNQLNAERSSSINTRASERLEEQRVQSTLRNEKTLVERDLTSARNEIGSLKNLIEAGKNELSLVKVEKDNQIALVKVELTEKESELKELEKSMADLRVDHEKENAEKELQIRLSQEELLEEKIRLKQEKLETFAGDTKISLEQIQNLCDYYETIISSRLSYNRDGIKEAEKSISKIKQEISQSGIQMGKIQKFCHKCEKMAKLRSQLDQILSQQFEAKQEQEKANEEMRKVNQAFEILGDEDLRKKYDLGITDFPSDTPSYQYDYKEEVRRQEAELRRKEGEIIDLELEILKLEMKALDRSSTLNEIGAAFNFTFPQVHAEHLDSTL
ncbi:5648_t:CDS:2 [Funneliformis geosporum]|nr:5648_t:CDS:2 [Funneliformis geosporum]